MKQKIRISEYHTIFYREWQLDPSASKYNIVFDQTLSETLDTYRLKCAIYNFINEYLIFNSHIVEESEQYYWTQNKKIAQLEYFGINDASDIFRYTSKPFDLNKGPLYRFAIFTDTDKTHRFIMVLHHILIDGNSFDQYIDVISNYYNSIDYHNQLDINTQEILLQSISHRQLTFNAEAASFWRSVLMNAEPIDLNFLKSSTITTDSQQINSITWCFPGHLINSFTPIQHQYNITLYGYSMTIFAILIHKYTAQTNFSISYPIKTKESLDLHYGAAVTTSCCPWQFTDTTTILELFNQYKTFIVKAKRFDWLEAIKYISKLSKGVLNVFFANTNLKYKKLVFNNVSTISVNQQFNLDLPAKLVFELDLQRDPYYQIRYLSSKFDAQITNQFIVHYKKLFIEILENFHQLHDTPIMSYSLLTQAEYQQIIHNWNNTRQLFPSNKTIHQLFEEQVAKTPNNIAIIYADALLTYHELNCRANQLARYMQNNCTINPDSLIAVHLNRGSKFIITVLAILKVGAAYLPISPAYPSGRIGYILQDTNIDYIITDNLYYEKLQQLKQTSNYHIYNLDDQEFNIHIRSLAVENLQNRTNPHNLAYVIYTSGTTGTPKGVMIEHLGVVSLVINVNYVKINTNDCLALLSDLAFDAATFEIFGALLNGARLYIPQTKLDVLSKPDEFAQLLIKHNITILFLTKVIFDQLYIENNAIFKSLKYLLVGGEALDYILVKEMLLSKNYPEHFLNIYGPTENTTFSCAMELNAKNINLYHNTPIGKPITNKTAYVINVNSQTLSPIGGIGELYVGGAGLARGYLQAKLTADKFITNMLPDNQRLYRTGDIVRLLVDGNIEYIGRIDSQIKIRGYRIELSEIENTLVKYSDITQAVVVAQNNNYLVAYYVATIELDSTLIMKHLTNYLPDYMIPIAFVHLEHLPVTTNGKIDRSALPLPKLTANYIAPTTDIEQRLCQLFSTILDLPQQEIGINHDFFQLGGNSILAIKLNSKINHMCNSNIKVKDIFNCRTIANLANVINRSDNFIYQQYLIGDTDVNLYEPFELNNVQQAYYLGRMGNFTLGNVATHLYMEYIFREMDITKLETALNKLIDRHHGLRTIFIDGKQQYIRDYSYYKIKFYTLADNAALEELRKNYSHKTYNIDQLWLFDIFISKIDNKYLLHISIDGLIMDAESMRIFFHELTVLYQNLVANLPTLDITYKDYIMQNNKIRNSDLFKHAKQYWQTRLTEYNFELELPLKQHASSITKPVFSRVSRAIEQSTWSCIQRKANEHNIGLTSIILVIYGYVLSCWSNQKNLCINLTLFNRLPLHQHINNIIGDFTVLELFNYVDNQDTLINVFQATHEQLWRDIEHNIFDGIDFQRLVRETNNLSSKAEISPVVLTSILGVDIYDAHFINDSYAGINYSITQTSQVWLDNKAYERDGALIAEWDYVKDLFDNDIITAMHRDYCALIEYIAIANWHHDKLTITYQDIDQDNSTPIRSLTLFNDFETYAVSSPENIAVIDSHRSYTYDELKCASDLLAKHIVSIHKQKNELIAILCEKSYNQVVSVIGIMKAGYAYLPLHAEWPIGRICEILQQAQAKLLLISQQHIALKATLSSICDVAIIEDVLSLPLTAIDLPHVCANDIAYVIYTSGTTGIPKGVTISHISALNTIDAVNNQFNINEQDSVLALSELSFDLSVFDIFGLLSVGGRVIFPQPELVKQPEHWLSLIAQHKITIWNTVPQLVNIAMDSAYSNSIISIRLFLLSGDWIPSNLPDRLRDINTAAQVISLGGATECSIWSIWYEVRNIKHGWKSIPYGFAMPNQKIYILNHRQQHCPIGVKGEIYIGGIGLALDYYKDSIKTRENFILHNTLGRIYKTGDMGIKHKNGYIIFAGRRDTQIKLHGYRIELGEIEANLTKLPGIKNAVSLLQTENNHTYIVAYLVATQTNANEGQFKMRELGIINDLAISYNLSINLDEDRYRARKSYRNFIDNAAIDPQEVITICNNTLYEIQKDFNAKQNFNTIEHDTLIANLLSPLSNLRLHDKALPKYLYPSAGSSYSVRCYLNIAHSTVINSGYYYYNPSLHSLHNVQNSQLQNTFMDLVIHWPAIKPLYNDSAERFAYIEVGHMLNLLIEQLKILKLGANIKIHDMYLDSENSLAIRIHINHSGNIECQDMPWILQLSYLVQKHGVYSDQKHQVDTQQIDIFSRCNGYSGKLIADGKMLLCIDGNNKINNYIMAGYFYQKVTEKLLERNISGCTLGYRAYSDALYTMVLGRINSFEISSAESKGYDIPVAQYIDTRLRAMLPTYMLPHSYIFLERLPLSPNGKLDKSKLPQHNLLQNTYVAPRNIIEQQIVNIYADILNINADSIGIYDDFFNLGGDSIMAIYLNTKLQDYFNIKLQDIFTFSTPAQLATRIAPNASGNLIKTLEHVKSLYSDSALNHGNNVKICSQTDYVSKIKINCANMISIKNILLTGATGYLGCNLLYQLLKSTDYNVILIIRASDEQQARERINNKYELYFDDFLNQSRIKVLCGNLEEKHLGLSDDIYYELTHTVDCIIHSAATVKHYGKYSEFYAANVETTINLLKLSLQTQSKLFHYMSTYRILELDNNTWHDEDCMPQLTTEVDMVYSSTKLQAEHQVIKYREYGIKSNIYRLGNLAFIAANSKFQENISNNAFANWLKFLLTKQAVGDDMAYVEISPVDLTAIAIIKLFDKQDLINNTYHVFNPHPYDISSIKQDITELSLQKIPMTQFIDKILADLENNINYKLLTEFLLHQGWLNANNFNKNTKLIIQSKTSYILSQLGFEWQPIRDEVFSQYAKKLLASNLTQ